MSQQFLLVVQGLAVLVTTAVISTLHIKPMYFCSQLCHPEIFKFQDAGQKVMLLQAISGDARMTMFLFKPKIGLRRKG